MAKPARGRNLFSIDPDAIESILSDANQTLLRDRDKLLRGFNTLPETLTTSEDIQQSQEFAQEVEETLSEAKKARLSDGRPFSDASKIVKDFFQRIEGPLKATLDELQVRVTRAALSRQRQEPVVPKNAGDAEAISVVTSHSGAPAIATAGSGSVSLTLQWTVTDFDRSRLDLEQLRPFLTDSALLTACRKHLEVNGPHKLAGASYEQIAEL